MLITKVKKLLREDRLIYWVKERESIRVLKERGDPKPWTDDSILGSYKFCNIRRINDTVSQWLLHNWYEPNFDHRNALLACTLARQLNRPEALEAVRYPKAWQPKRVQSILERRASDGLPNYNSAYVVSPLTIPGQLRQTKPYQTVWQVCDPIANAIANKDVKIDTSSVERTWRILMAYRGFGPFITGQVVADLCLSMSGDWSDRYKWASVGVGSSRGANRIMNNPIKINMKQEEFLGILKNVMKLLKREIPNLVKGMEAIDFQNCLCEFDKYERTLWGQGSPKCRYDGGLYA